MTLETAKLFERAAVLRHDHDANRLHIVDVAVGAVQHLICFGRPDV